jgi:superfamily II DNA or RNA helicase
MLAKTLRDDQALAIYNIRQAVAQGTRRLIVQAATGFGKGLLIADIVNRARLKNNRVMITVPAILLVDQTLEVLAAQGIRNIGVIQADHPMTDWSQPIQVCSVQTLARCWADGRMPKADVVLLDEVHRKFTFFPRWAQDIEWQEVPFIGFSATPWTKGLGSYYNRLIIGNTIDNLIAQGTLVPFRTFAPDMPDLSDVSTTRNDTGDSDFVEAEIDKVMRGIKLVANIVETWKQLAEGRPTVAFCCSRAHAEQLAKEFTEAGIGAGYMDCKTPSSERKEIRRKMLAGEIKVVCNVEIVGIGIDWPEVSCIVYARPTMSDMRFVQNIGRGLRAHPGKVDLMVLDHSTTTMRLGFVNEIYAMHTKLDDGKTKPTPAQGMLLPKECPACHYLKAPRVVVCPNCGHQVEAHATPVLMERGTLREYTPGLELAALRKRLPDREHVFGQLVWWRQRKGYKPYWENVQFQKIYGVAFPRNLDYHDKITAPCAELAQWIYDSTKRWKAQQDNAKRKARLEANGPTSKGGLTVNEQIAWERARAEIAEQYVGGTLCTEQDLEDF